MILSGASIVTRHLVPNLRNIVEQQQPCGVDLTLRHVSEWKSPAIIDFDNVKRKPAKTQRLPYHFNDSADENDTEEHIALRPGAYLIDFNETVKIPLDRMATIMPRSSLWRSGVTVSAGVIDAGSEGALGAMLEVKNPRGIVLYKNAKIAQIVFYQMEGVVEGYSGIHQASEDSAGRHEKAEEM